MEAGPNFSDGAAPWKPVCSPLVSVLVTSLVVCEHLWLIICKFSCSLNFMYRLVNIIGCLFARQFYFQIVSRRFSVAFPLLIGLAWIEVESGIVLCLDFSCFMAFQFSLFYDFCFVALLCQILELCVHIGRLDI